MPRRTFADIYCERHGISRQMYHTVVFRRALFPHARLVAGAIRIFDRLHFLPDHEFVEATGHITCVADFALPLGSFIEHPGNRGKLRRVFRLRVSARRLLQLVREAFADHARGKFSLERGTFQPFPGRRRKR